MPDKSRPSISGSFLLVLLNVYDTWGCRFEGNWFLSCFEATGKGKCIKVAWECRSQGKFLLSINYRLFVLHVKHQNDPEMVPFPMECQEWRMMMMNKCCCDVFVCQLLSLSCSCHWSISFNVSATGEIFFPFSFLNWCLMLIFVMLKIFHICGKNVFVSFPFVLFMFRLKWNIRTWLCSDMRTKLSLRQGWLVFQFSDTGKLCVCMYVVIYIHSSSLESF